MKNIKVKDIVNWVLGMLLCSLGVSFCTKASFGLSMIAAIPYTLHLGFREALPWFTQGTAEYCFQAVLLLLTCFLVWRFRWKYLLAFGTAVIAGFCIDGWLWVLGGNAPYASLWARIPAFVAGVVLTAIAIAFFFRTKMPLQVYELTVSELSDRFRWKVETVKLIFDIIMLALAIGLSFLMTGTLTGAGVGLGTIAITFLNAPLIKFFGKLIDKWGL